jgi:protein-S-isoprenylcysteine O-methyltransferase Ste14
MRIYLRILRMAGFMITLYLFHRIQYGAFSRSMTSIMVVGAILLVFPIVWIGRKIVDIKPSIELLAWITSFVHILLMILFGTSIIAAIKLFQVWPGLAAPLPVAIGKGLLYFTGACLMLTVLNLAISGLGAPFAIALSKRIADRWIYKWTRNPMVLCTLAVLVSAGLYFHSVFFILWVVLLVAPAWIYFLKVYEERELEIRFGGSYLEYRSKTPFLWPGKIKG